MKYLYEHFHLWCVTNVRKEKYIAKQQQEAQEKETQIHTKHKAEGQQAGWQTEAVAVAVAGACRVAIIMMIIIAVKHATRASALSSIYHLLFPSHSKLLS